MPDGWTVEAADVDNIGYWLGRRTDRVDDPALSIRFCHDEPLAFAHVVLRTLAEFVDFVAALEGITPHLRHGMSIETKYY